MGKNPGIFDMLVTLVPSQLTAQVPSLCLYPFRPLVLLVSSPWMCAHGPCVLQGLDAVNRPVHHCKNRNIHNTWQHMCHIYAEPAQGHALEEEARLVAAALETAFQVDLGGAAAGWGRCLAVHAEGPAVAAGAQRRCMHVQHVRTAPWSSLLRWTCMLTVWLARRTRSGLCCWEALPGHALLSRWVRCGAACVLTALRHAIRFSIVTLSWLLMIMP